MIQYTAEKDEILVDLTLMGNSRVYEELVIRHEKAVMGTAVKVIGNEYSAENAAQDAFVSAWMHLGSLREPAQFRSWVCSIAQNCAKNLAVRYRNTVPDIFGGRLQF